MSDELSVEGVSVKVTMLTPSAGHSAGGIYWSLIGLLGGLDKRNLAAEVYSYYKQGVEERSAAEFGDNSHLYPVTGPRTFCYAPALREALSLSDANLVHLHGLWTYSSIAVNRWSRVTGKPYVVSPHGMLDEWALSKSASKKRVASLLYEGRALREAAVIHALCESEYRSIRNYGLKNPVAVIPNGVETQSETVKREFPKGLMQYTSKDKKILLFLGRVCDKKGLDVLLRAWKEALMKSSSVRGSFDDWRLLIAGWDEDGYGNYLRNLISQLDLEHCVVMIGPVFGSEKAAVFEGSDTFILPSLSEGLPMAVLEAWSYGLPVVMTKECNFTGVFENGIAIEVRPDIDSMSSTLLQLGGMSSTELTAIGQKGQRHALENYDWQVVAEKFVSAYLWALGLGERPSHVILD